MSNHLRGTKTRRQPGLKYSNSIYLNTGKTMRRLDETHQNWKCDSALPRRRTLLKNNHWNHINHFSSKYSYLLSILNVVMLKVCGAQQTAICLISLGLLFCRLLEAWVLFIESANHHDRVTIT